MTTPLSDEIAKAYNCRMKTVLTGFKYIGGEILALEEKNEEKNFVFGFEESCGYLKGTYARDKDAVVASMLVCEMAASLKQQGLTILEALDRMYQTYGYYLAKVQSVELTGSDAMEKAAAIMEGIRENVPASVGGLAVTELHDYRSRVNKNLVTGAETPIDLPKSNVIEMILGDKGSVIARPSGTEPKIKYYYTSVGASVADAEKQLDAMIAQMQGA